MTALTLQPITQREAFTFIATHHRHHGPPQGTILQVAVSRCGVIIGVATVGRPVARMLDNGWTAEVTRLCTSDTPDAQHAASKLYAACWRAARALGYLRLITYTLVEESGTSVRAAGWRALYQTQGASWDRAGRPRVDKHPTGPKTLWEVTGG